MLKRLFLSNLILVDQATIPFGPGFNVLSGETGAGKSAIMAALSLATGKRAEASLIRKGADKGVVEAEFLPLRREAIAEVLAEEGLSVELEETLVIRRELASSGKSRALVNDQVVSVGLLSRLSPLLLDIVGQHANQSLQDPDYPRSMVDAYGKLGPLIKRFQESYGRQRAIEEALASLKQSESQRLRQLEICRYELEELQSAQVTEGEEEELFSEYTRLMNAQTLGERLQEVCHTLVEGPQNVLAALREQRRNLEKIAELDRAAQPSLAAFDSVLLELEECAYSLNAAKGRLDDNPHRVEQLNERLSLLRRLKKKYGPEDKDLLLYQRQAEERLQALETADEEIFRLEADLPRVLEETLRQAETLSEARTETAARLSERLTEEIRKLNMDQAVVELQRESTALHAQGMDLVECYLSPNVGEKRLAARHCASGGELSRLMLALKTVLSGHEEIPVLVFDEIDANIGGHTASVVGQRLQQLGQHHQVICVTHFPQVASQAQHHIKIAKGKQGGRTVTQAHVLSPSERQAELTRMMGGASTVEKLVEVS